MSVPRILIAGLRGGSGKTLISLGLAAASLSLLITGVMPIMRIGAAMALGLACSALVASVSRRMGSRGTGSPEPS